MDTPTLAALCRRFSLGAPVASPEPVHGGLMHRIWRVTTDRGVVAVKALNPNGLDPARLRHSETIAAAAAKVGIPAVCAFTVDGDPLHTIDGAALLVYPWIAGETLAAGPAAPERAAQIGEILGRMHALSPFGLTLPETPTPSGFSEAWETLAEAARAQGEPWADTLADALPDIARWEARLAAAQRALPATHVLSHADLHQQNVLWESPTKPWLIDWESAGLQQPAKEAAVSALEWSGFVDGAPDFATFAAFLTAYRSRAPLTDDDLRHGLDACFGNWLGWLHLNVLRALGRTTADPAEKALGVAQVTGTLSTIRRAEAHFPTLAEAGR